MIDRSSRPRASAAVSSGRTVLAPLLILLAGTATAQPPRDGKDAPGTSVAIRPSPAPGLVEQLGDHLLGRVQAAWPDPPEWVAMLFDILKGSQLGPGDGWFKKAVAQTRYDWSRRPRGSTATATARSGGASSPAPTPTSPGSTATATACSPLATSTSRRTR